MAGFDTEILTEMLRQIKAGDRCGLSPDVFAAVFPPGHHDPAAFAAARDFAAALRCDIDYWRATNEVFFTKRPRMTARAVRNTSTVIPGRERSSRARNPLADI